MDRAAGYVVKPHPPAVWSEHRVPSEPGVPWVSMFLGVHGLLAVFRLVTKEVGDAGHLIGGH